MGGGGDVSDPKINEVRFVCPMKRMFPHSYQPYEDSPLHQSNTNWVLIDYEAFVYDFSF